MRGVIVGSAHASQSNGYTPAAFELKGNKSTSIAPAGSMFSAADFVTDDGTIGCSYTDAAGTAYGFLLAKGVFPTLDYPGSYSSNPVGIGSHGEVIGVCGDPTGNYGCVYLGGKFYSIGVSGYKNTVITGVNGSGTIVGYVGPYTGQPDDTRGFVAACPAQNFSCTQ